MGSILSSKVLKDENKVIFEVLADYEEALQLKGSIDNVHIFSENIADIKTNLSMRGKNEATKYFLIPKQLRKDLRFGVEDVICQRINTPTKIIFVYVIDKIKLR
jgi:hypothetical protein